MARKPIKRIRITNAALEEPPGGAIVLRGVIDTEGLTHVKIPDYQKKTHAKGRIKKLGDAILNGDRMPDIELSMRSSLWESAVEDGRDVIYLNDLVYLTDGYQRTLALRAVASREETRRWTIGAIVNLNTIEAWERQRFEKLGTSRTQVAPSVILRNSARDNQIAEAIYALTTTDPACVLHNRVTWDQHQVAGEIVLASTVYRVAILLHSWIVPPSGRKPHDMVTCVNQIAEQIGDAVLLGNIRKFFELADHYWGFRTLMKRDGVIQLRADFLFIMAELMAQLRIFWDGSQIEDNLTVRRLKPRLAVSEKLREWLSPGRTSRTHILIYYKSELNKGRPQPLAERVPAAPKVVQR